VSGGSGAYAVSHRWVRLVASANFLQLGLEMAFPSYFHLSTRGELGNLLDFWFAASSLLLPAYVGFQVWWMRRSPTERRALWVDAVLAVAWFVFLWGGTFYTLFHSTIL
jgi:hypothetical protein